MERYSEYKETGIEWIGEIPNDWTVKKIKHKCSVKARVGWKGLKSDEFLIKGYSYLVTGSDFKRDTVVWEYCYQIDQERYEEDPYIQLQEEDLLITKDGTIGKLAIVKNLDKPACLNSGIFVVRPTEDDFTTKYLFWLLKSKAFSQFNDYTSYGSTIQHLYQNVFVEFWFPFPTLEVQTQIANYLDTKTAEIDNIIAAKKKLIALYEEEKAAVINHAVTKGINPDVNLKPSGVDWLGDIPVNWIVSGLKYVTKEMISGPFGSSLKKETYTKTGYKIYGQEQVIKGDVNYGDYYIAEEKYQEMLRYKVSAKDILISCVGTFGKILQVPTKFQEGIINPRLIKISLNEDRIDPDYLERVLKSKLVFDQLEALSRGGTMGVINLDLLKQLVIPLPPLKEQKPICDFITHEEGRLNNLISKAKQLIVLLTEYRTTLISEVVTGKIKVTA
ncbi:restriction endonuclease subunit S [Algoriphagus pacificus]|uniref:Restriction endonuclease subunit S n=1 Tax=Algoriphagus pacificus TaxID=2811234 RepID=A0ABS3CGN3_9BACT|nr:restriction endonuclease subunit S [Algoriphagus pacificus]MBN7816252.1 restriction endonuclease subunit S [Algoriphagus pacificus]